MMSEHEVRPPKHRHAEIIRHLERALDYFEREHPEEFGPISLTSGSPGGTLSIASEFDPDQTEEQYSAQLMTWFDQRKKVSS